MNLADKNCFSVNTPKAVRPLWNYFVNEEYHTKFSQTAQGSSNVFSPRERTITRDYRYFYIKNNSTGTCYNPNYVPMNINSDSYTCTHKAGYSEIISEKDKIQASIRLFVPLTGKYEIWTVKIKNCSESEVSLDFFAAFSLNTSGMGSRCVYNSENKMFYSYAFPYHVKYEEYDDKKCEDNYSYLICSDLPKSYDCGELRFFENDNHSEVPEAVLTGECSNCISENDKPLAAPHNSIRLAAGEEHTFYYILGACSDIEDTAMQFGKLGDIRKWSEYEFEQCNKFWENSSNGISIESSEPEFDKFVNYWLPKQVISMNLTHRFEELSCVRNELQDALGYSMINPEKAFLYLKRVFALQEKSGNLKQWHIVNNTSPIRRLGLLTYYDGPIWLILCASIILRRLGDSSYIYEKIPYCDTEDAYSIYEHIISAIRFLELKRGSHGLVLFADGDWTDPLNGMGKGGKGETVWGSEALLYAVKVFTELPAGIQDKATAEYLKAYTSELEKSINTYCWDGEWYILGYNDNGERIGTSKDEEGRIFLNAQTWAIISGVAKGERLLKTLKTINSIDTVCGPMVNYPPFSGWNKNIGRASLKLSGTTENGAVYCHASMFKAYAECVAGRYEDAYKTIIKTLPTNIQNPPEKNLQAPIFVPNYYYGIVDSPNFGISSNVYSTGTVNWMLWVIFEQILGISQDINGLTLDPHIPSEWENVKITYKYKTSTYKITLAKKGEKGIWVNGKQIKSRILPYNENTVYYITVID